MAKVLLYEIRINGQDVLIKNQAELRQAIRLTNKELDGAQIGSQRYKDLQRNLGGLKEIQKQVRAETRQQGREFVKAADAGKGSYRGLQAELSNLKNEFKELSAEARDGIGGQKLQSRIRSLDGELKRLDKSLGDNFRNVGNYQSAFSGLAGKLKGGLIAAGISLGVQEVSQAVVASIKVFSEFEDKIKILGAISGATGEDLQVLENDARRLGETTQFTATQIADLQTNFARVGFDTSQILAATEATTNLSVATGEDLAKSSETVAATLGGYQLSAEETARVTDLMTASFNTSALELESFGESTKFVAPIAKVLGVSIEQTTATLGALADAGLKGTVSGSALRRIFTELGTEGSKLSDVLGITVTDADSFNVALQRLGEKNIDVAAATDLVGRNAASAFAVLAGNTDKVLQLSGGFAELTGNTEALGLTSTDLEALGQTLDEIPEKYQNLATAAETARQVQDSLAGDQRLFASALEGLQLRFVGFFEGALRDGTQAATSSLALVGDVLEFLVESFSPVFDAIGTLISALFGGGDAAITFGGIVDFVAGFITLFANVLTGAIENFARLITFFKEGAKEIPILGPIIQKVTGFFQELFLSIVQLPDFINGVIAAVKQFANNVRNQNFDVGVGEAFRKGFEESKTLRAKIKDETEGLADDLKASSGPIKTAGEDLGEDLGESISKGVKKGLEDTVVEGSIKALQKQISELKADLENEVDQNAIAETLEELINKEQELEAFKNQIEEVRENLERLLIPLTDLEFDELVQATREFQESIEEGFLDGVQGLAQARVDEQVQEIERNRLQRLAALEGQREDEEAYLEERKLINLEAEREIIRAQLALAEVGSNEYLALKQQLADQEAAIRQGRGANQAQAEIDLNEQLLNAAIQGVQDIAGAIFEIEEQNLERRLARKEEALNEEYASRLAAVEEGSLEELRLETEFEAQKQALARQAAEERRKLAIRQAIINTALAVGTALATTQPFIPNALIAAGIAAVRGGAEIAVIRNQTFADGGEIDGPSHSRGGVKKIVRSTGQRVELEGGEGVLNKRTMGMNRVVSLSGTPRAIASSLNQLGGGVAFRGASGATMFESGGIISSAAGNAGTVGQMVAEINIELPDEAVQRIAEATRAGSSQGAESGSRKGLKDQNRLAEREQALENRINI